LIFLFEMGRLCGQNGHFKCQRSLAMHRRQRSVNKASAGHIDMTEQEYRRELRVSLHKYSIRLHFCEADADAGTG
jgi:hypothetical protein